MSTYYAILLGLSNKPLFVPTRVATSIGDSLIVDRVYRLYLVTIKEYDTWVDLIVLDMVDFDNYVHGLVMHQKGLLLKFWLGS